MDIHHGVVLFTLSKILSPFGVLAASRHGEGLVLSISDFKAAYFECVYLNAMDRLLVARTLVALDVRVRLSHIETACRYRDGFGDNYCANPDAIEFVRLARPIFRI